MAQPFGLSGESFECFRLMTIRVMALASNNVSATNPSPVSKDRRVVLSLKGNTPTMRPRCEFAPGQSSRFLDHRLLHPALPLQLAPIADPRITPWKLMLPDC